MEILENFAAVPIIVTAVYGIMALYKQLAKGREKALNLIPALAALLGAALGIALFYAIPEMIPASNLITALIIGGVSGLSATGINQTAKQLKNIIKPANNGNLELTDTFESGQQPEREKKDSENEEKDSAAQSK